MNNVISQTPRVFISYAWTSEEHNEWVISLATRLRENGVDVKFDKWDLKEGQDIYAFMESMVRSDEIDKVLMICDRGYREKADQRIGGVGTETQIITPEVYSDITQQKFIPIVSERDENGEHFVPTYIKSRLYIDLSSEERYEEGYERLLRNLFNKPLLQKPALGKPPAFLLDEGVPHYKTINVLKQLNDAVVRNPKRVKGLTNAFMDSLVDSLEQFVIEKVDDSNNLDDIIVENIEKMLPLRNDYVQLLELLCENDEIDIDAIINLFEKLYNYTYFSGSGSYFEIQFDHFKFFIQELFIYTSMILIERQQFNKLAELLHSEFFITNRHQENTQVKYDRFRFYLKSLDVIRNEKLALNKISVTAQLLVERCNQKRYPKQKLVSTDLMLYYLSVIHFDEHYKWFPCTYIYGEYTRVEMLARLKSRRHFEKIKPIFEVETSDQLKEMLSTFNHEFGRGYQNSYSTIPHIKAHINPDEVCTSS